MIERLLRRWFNHKELGWAEIGETFTRFVIFRCWFFSIYLHKLDAPTTAQECHDHPWHFWVWVLRGGYWEDMNDTRVWRGPFSVFYRTARSLHNTTTRRGHTNWSLILVSRKCRDWGFKGCDPAAD